MRAHELHDVPANAHIVDRTPHDAVLERCRLAISHAGHGLVMKSLIHGVPMILVPWDRDQSGSAYRAGQLGTAEITPRDRLTLDSMSQAIDRVFSTDSFQDKSTNVSRRIEEEDSVEMACDLLESAMT
jgi:UDP:flavonoid glycosyltransferase YjiC (YdhE family)